MVYHCCRRRSGRLEPLPIGAALVMEDNAQQNATGVPVPDDNTTLTEVLDLYAAGGFAGLFGVSRDGLVDCGTCASASEPTDVPMHSMRRLEGASDPDDMMAVAAVTCPVCGTLGTITMAFGPMASSEDARVLAGLKDHRHDAAAPPHSAPDEMTEGTTPAPSPGSGPES